MAYDGAYDDGAHPKESAMTPDEMRAGNGQRCPASARPLLGTCAVWTLGRLKL